MEGSNESFKLHERFKISCVRSVVFRKTVKNIDKNLKNNMGILSPAASLDQFKSYAHGG